MEKREVVKVGIAEMNVVKRPFSIRTSGLGSCVAIVVYDTKNSLAGLAHVMLPDSTLAKYTNLNKAKYVDTAIPVLIHTLLENGAKRESLKAKIAGGSEMFKFTSNELMRIGPRNVEAVNIHLQKYRVPVISSDVGGSNGRTVEFNTVSNLLVIKTASKRMKEI
ncbi:chemotaxis protein CheD [Bacillus carboniphilus]|uniref:Chemoreceptor glutamine deamidase CheD n=1 Tax=Bacillus carboniphilus TaxID=86663 RepID=A0ABY9JVT1_9BACI|nr:chemotaxis protein CheD [Bacillus carboniphilus]WLR43519.1 chemotaxis protein CheD [Bacillus carboniphilus]